MTKKLTVLLLTLLLMLGQAKAQINEKTIADIRISWELLQNKYEGKNNQFLAQLTIHNVAKNSSFPANNWELYFSYPRDVIQVVKGAVDFTFIQGEFKKMSPTANFKSILPGEKVVIQYVGKGFTQNTSDALSGLYFLVGNKTFPVHNYNILPILNSGVKNITATELFKKYERTANLESNSSAVILPTPLSAVSGLAEISIHSNFSINTDKAFVNEAELLAEDFKTIFGKAIPTGNGKETKNAITFQKLEGLADEAYELAIATNGGVLIKASSRAGAFYAIKSLTNLFPAQAWMGKSKSFVLKEMTVKDQPRFGYRSFMMDVARNFQSKTQVKKIIDLMSIYKLNTLHFHLNDDEGWRLQIPSLPELTEVGAKRAHTFNESNLQPSYGSGPDVSNKAGSGFYSEQDFIEILKYAAARHIQVIPEIETPGHARAAIKAMTYRYHKLMAAGDKKAAEKYLLVELDDKSVHRSVQSFTDNIMNVALPSTYQFVETVVDDMLKMYSKAGVKSTTIHIGGDEVPKGSWEKSEAALALIKDKQVNSIDELWYYYLTKVNKIFAARGIQLAGWEEIAMRKTMLDGKPKYIVNANFVNDNFRVYVWNTAWGRGNEDLAYKLANAGYKTVLASVSNFYFDLAYNKDNDERGLYWGGYVDTDKPFYFVPFDYYKTAKENYLGAPVDKAILQNKERLTDFGKSNILGLQSLLWSEKVTTAEQLEYMLFPKILGFAERAWAASPDWAEEKNQKKSEEMYANAWTVFANTLGKKELPKLDYYAGGVAYRIPPVGVQRYGGNVSATVQFPGLQIRYTTNGTEPTANSKLYQKPVAFVEGMKFKAFNTTGRSSKTTTLTKEDN